jgi:pyruvate dehydrogenase E2 component (dihydrolipoamide acetyltransferase)
MARFEFNMPDVGEGLADVEIIEWFVEVGDTIEENQPIADVETDKAIVTMPAPATGKIVELAARVGERVKVGAVLLVIETDGGAVPEPLSEVETASDPAAEAEVSDNGQAQANSSSTSRPVMASPVARKMAQEFGVNLEDVVGTGPRGRITTDDVQQHSDQLKRDGGVKEAAPSADVTKPSQAPGPVERIPVRGLRRRIAEALAETARTVPHVAGFHEFDAQALIEERSYLKPYAEAAGTNLTFLPFIVKAVAVALQKHPYLNASFVDGDEPEILLKKHYNIGIAAATDEGLVVPVIRHADRLDLFEIARRSEALITSARERRIAPAEMKEGTFTISNVGPAGGWFGTSIIRAPEAAILGVGKIEERAVVRNGQIVARPILPIALTFDHRVIDGDEALAFVQTLRQLLETDPRSLAPR